jgi:hypothetical protein
MPQPSCAGSPRPTVSDVSGERVRLRFDLLRFDFEMVEEHSGGVLDRNLVRGWAIPPFNQYASTVPVLRPPRLVLSSKDRVDS